MKKRIAFLAVLAFVLTLLAGCAGTTVIYTNQCTCPTGGHTNTPNTPETPVVGEGSVKTGLAIVTSIKNSQDATVADYDLTIVAVNVDDEGVITDCVIDSVGTKVNFDATGKITSDLNTQVQTKNELGDAYGMVGAGAKYEWYQQAEALANFAVGKTVAQLKSGAIDETGKAPAGSDLASTATIYLGGYVAAIEEAVKNAAHLGAQAGDELRLVVKNSLGSSKSATAEKAGAAQLDSTAMALNVKDGVITACAIDAVQAKVSFDATGKITTDLTAQVLTKNQLGDAYGMVGAGAKYEWYQQAASFGKYVTGKTAEQVAGIAVSQGKPTDADLAATVTIAIGDFQELIAKAFA
ncbi:MAG: hypothetical protein J6Q30_00995 [Oscillospiraceae bacterium]|nr:hypothetical protein [Oscillospiraceae bacterium]